MAAIELHGGAVDPGAVCASVWRRKSAAEKRDIRAMLEEGAPMAKKSAKKAKKTSKKKAHKGAKRSAKRRKGEAKCASCGHRRHAAGDCTHFSGGGFCRC